MHWYFKVSWTIPQLLVVLTPRLIGFIYFLNTSVVSSAYQTYNTVITPLYFEIQFLKISGTCIDLFRVSIH